MEYSDFLKTKIAASPSYGFDIDREAIHESLFPHQRDAVAWAIRGGRRALFESFGLGKTRQQIEILRQIKIERASSDPICLIIAPLGVRQEFRREAASMGLTIEYVKSDADIEASKTDLLITNYERVRDGGISQDMISSLTAVSLDEASVLRGYGTKTYQEFLPLFKNVPFRFVATATPSPNRYKELIHYAGFLGIMDTGQALTRFFQRDSSKAGNLTLYPHKEDEFWKWVSTWALFVTKPSDLGHSNEGYDLPPINVIWHEIDTAAEGAEADSWGQHKMFSDAAAGLQEAARVKRETLDLRLEKACEIIGQEPGENWLLWHHLENERRAIEKAIPDAVTIYGSQDLDEREQKIVDFSEGKIRVLAPKPEIAGSGCNFQHHCSRAVFLGINYKFNDLIQAIHRIYRFQQTKPVEIHIIYADSERPIRREIEAKWARHDRLLEKMTEIISTHGLSKKAIEIDLQRSIGADRKEVAGELFTAIHNDCVVETSQMKADSVDMILTSIPFGTQYEYCESYNDFGHNDDNEKFFEQMDFLIPELLRVLKPGRVAAIHVKDRIRFGNVTGLGMTTVDRFSDKTADAFEKHGFAFFGRITVTTDVVRENNQTYRLGWSEMCKDGTKMGVGMPEYVLLFRKLPSDLSNSYADTPVTRSKDDYTRAQWQIDAHAHWRSSGDRLLKPEELASMSLDTIKSWYKRYSDSTVYDYKEHVEMGSKLEAHGHLPASFMLFEPSSHKSTLEDVSPTWTDILRMRTLNAEQSRKREMFHVCPFQIDIVERLVERFTNRATDSGKGDLVFDPFAGLFTVPYVAIQMGRRGIGCELNTDYYQIGTRYCRTAEAKQAMPTLFDQIDMEVEHV